MLELDLEYSEAGVTVDDLVQMQEEQANDREHTAFNCSPCTGTVCTHESHSATQLTVSYTSSARHHLFAVRNQTVSLHTPSKQLPAILAPNRHPAIPPALNMLARSVVA